MNNFILEISYSQIAIFIKGTKFPFNDWTDIHVKQGFAWRSESVCFGSLLNDGKCMVNVSIQKSVKVLEGSIRTIVVPFHISEHKIEVASITQGECIQMPKGLYELVFNVIPKSNENDYDIYDIAFVETSTPIERILLADDMLNPPDKLLMEANPAI